MLTYLTTDDCTLRGHSVRADALVHSPSRRGVAAQTDVGLLSTEVAMAAALCNIIHSELLSKVLLCLETKAALCNINIHTPNYCLKFYDA